MPDVQNLLSTIMKTLVDLANFTLVLFLIVFIFSLFGMSARPCGNSFNRMIGYRAHEQACSSSRTSFNSILPQICQ